MVGILQYDVYLEFAAIPAYFKLSKSKELLQNM